MRPTILLFTRDIAGNGNSLVIGFFRNNIYVYFRNLDIVFRLATFILLNAAGAGLAAPSVLVTRPISKVSVEWLPMDNQTFYRLDEGESRKWVYLSFTSMLTNKQQLQLNLIFGIYTSWKPSSLIYIMKKLCAKCQLSRTNDLVRACLFKLYKIFTFFANFTYNLSNIKLFDKVKY